MEFVVQVNLMNEQTLHKIKTAVDNANFPVQYVSILPFTREIVSDAPLEGTDFIPYGSTNMTNVAYSKEWRGCFFDLNKFDYKEYVKNFGNTMLNDSNCILTAIECIDFLKNYSKLYKYEEIFVRPALDLKTFAGFTDTVEHVYEWLCYAASVIQPDNCYAIAPDTRIVIDRPQNIHAEWRWFIVGGEVIDGSMYRYMNGLHLSHETDTDVIAEVQKLADQWLPSPCCVMDTCLLATGENKPRIIEFNCINSSGFYDHDVDKILSALYDYCKVRN